LTDFFLDLLGEGKRLVRLLFREILQPGPDQEVDPYADFPDAFLSELGAICQLAGWERAGLRPGLPRDLPTAEEALHDLIRRLDAEGDAAFHAPYTELTAAIYQTAIDRLAWTGRARLKADLLILAEDPERLVAALADLFWAHRHLAPHRS
jgi:hypothetical protein